MPPAVAVVAAGGLAGAVFSGVAVGVAIGLGTMALQQALKPDLPKSAESTDQAQRMITSAISPRRGIYGEAVVSGTMVAYGKTSDAESAQHVVALALAAHQCESAVLFEVNDKEPSETGATATVYLGNQTTADATLKTAVPGWTDKHIGYNITYAVTVVPVDSETLPSGLNKVTFKVKGRKLYDPRKDSTVGGSGSHRAEDPSTWEWSDNPILCALDYMRFFGYKPLSINRFNIAEIMTEADRCDELVSYTDDEGNTQYEKRFTCNGFYNYDEESGNVLQRILSSCMGKPYRRSGRLSIKTGGYSGIPTVTLTDKDLVGDVQYRPFAPVRERCNAVRGTYIEPNAGYTKTEAPVVKNETYRTEDGTYLEASLTLDFTNKATESQRLQKLYMERKRAGFIAEIEVGSIGLMLTPGSPVRLKLDSDGIDQTFVVEDWRFNPAKKTCSLVLLIDYPEIWTDDIYATVQRPQIVVPDNTTPGSVSSAIFTETPSEAWRVGYLTISGSVTREYNAYSVQIASADGVSRLEKVFTSVTNKVSISGLQTGAHGAYIRARASNGRWTQEFFTTFNLTSVFTIGDGKDGTSSAFFNGFESDDDRANLTTTEGSQAFNTDSYSGSTAVLIRNSQAAPVSTGSGNTHYLTIPEPLALMFAGQRVSVSVIAKQAATDPASEFAVAYSTSEVGNSGFFKFTPTADYQKFTFEYDVPLPSAGGTDFVIINADTSATGKGIVVDDIQIVIKGDKGEQGDPGPAPTVVDNGNGSYTITGSNGSITIYDGNDADAAPIPTITDNGNGTYTIDNGAGDVVTFSGGYTPQKGVDYFDGLNGDYVSFIYKNAVTKPATPTGGSFNGTTETFPTGWSDTKQAVPEGQLRWVSTVRYKNNLNGTYSQRTAWKAPAEDYQKGEQGPAPTVVDNGNGSYTITGSNGSITIYDGNDADAAPIPTITDNGNGTYTIDNGAGDVVTFSDGYTPQQGVDYFDGLNGDYVSFIYKNAATKPATPTGGSFNGTTETFPTGWSDTKQAVPEGQLRWVSTVRYKDNGNGTYSQRTAWKAPAEDYQKGDKGDQGERGITADAIVGRPGQQWGFKTGLEGWSLRNGDATYPSGKVRFVGTANDVGMVSPTFTKIAGAENYAIRVRIRTTSADHSTVAELYYTTDSHGQEGGYFKSIPVTFKQDEWIYLVFDMRDLSAGGDDYINSDISRIRVDFSNLGNGKIYEIDGVVIGYFGAADETDYTDDRINNDVLQPPGIAYGASGTIYLVKNSSAALTDGSSAGELGVSIGALYLPDNTKIVFGSATQISTPFEGAFPYTTGFVIASKQSTRTRFGSTFDLDAYIFTAIYSGGQWIAVDNLSKQFPFVPDQNDVVIGRIRRALNSSGIDHLEQMISSADITDYSDSRISNDEITQTQIQYGAGWAAMPASGATRNTGALADRNNIDLSNPGSFLLNRLGINYSNLETMNNRFSLGTDGYLTYTDASGNPVNVGNVTPAGIGASTLDEMLETSAGGNIIPDPTMSKLGTSGRQANYYVSLWTDGTTPRSTLTHDGTDAVWTLLSSALSGPGFTVNRLNKNLFIPAKKGDRFAVKVVATSPQASTNFRAYISERKADLTYNNVTTNFFNTTLNGARVTLGGIVEVTGENTGFVLLALRADTPTADLQIKLHSIEMFKLDESFSNDLITIGEDGKLYNGGSQQGQVTADGLGVKTYRVIARGTSAGTTPAGPGMYKNGQLVSSYARSYVVNVISRATGNYTSRTVFDVYGSATNAQSMATYLNGLGSDVIVAIITHDEPQTNRLTNGLAAAMYRCGASRAVFGSSEFKFRSAYALIGIPGCGEGNGAEFYQGEVDNDTGAWIDAGFQVVAGSITGVSGSYTPKTLKDYGFVGDLNANHVDNTNQLVDGAGLGDSALWSGVTGTGKPEDYATLTGAGSLVIDPTFERQLVAFSGASGWHINTTLGDGGGSCLAIVGATGRTDNAYAWILMAPAKYLFAPARLGDRFRVRFRYKGYGTPNGSMGVKILGRTENEGNGTNSEYLSAGTASQFTADDTWRTFETSVQIGNANTKSVRFYLWANTSFTQGTWLFDNIEIWKIPVGVDNDLVDSGFIKNRFGWTVAPSDGANKTVVVADAVDGRATLTLDGVTKYIDVFSSDSRTRWDRLRQGQLPTDATKYINQWGSISGTGKPSDGANKTEFVADGTLGRITYKLNDVTYTYDAVTQTQVDGRVTAVRPDASYKNDNIKPAKRWGSGSLTTPVAWLQNHNSETPPTGEAGKIIVNSLYGGVGFIHLHARDAEGGVRVSLNGTKIGEMSGNDNELRWYSFKVTNLVAGNNTVYVWSTSADGGDVQDWVITGNAVGDPEALLKSSPDVVDSRANSRVTALRPDSDYKNSNTTKAQVGLGNVPNYTEAQFNSSAVSAALQEALLRNPSGEGINFFNPLYQNPLNTSLCRDVANGTLTVNSTYDYGQPSRGSVFRLAATAGDARFYMAKNGTDFPIKLIPGKKWIISFWVLNNSNVGAYSTNIYFFYPNTTGGFHFQGTSYTTPGAYQSARISCVIDMTATTNDRNVATEACLRLDVDGGAGAALVWDQIMIEPLKDDSAVPSPYTPPFTQAPILRQKILPMVNTAGAGASSNSNPLSAIDDGSTAKINIASHTVQFADGSVSYNSGSISGLLFSTKYFIYTDDPYYVGGAVTYVAVPAANITEVTASIGRRYLGSITTPANGGGTSLPPQEQCPHAETWLTDSLQAKDVQVGDEIDGVQFGIRTPAMVRQVKHTTADCVKITSQSGAQIIVSVTTPIDREDGTSYRAINAAGERVQVEINGRLEWEPVQKVELLQDQPVVHISLGEISFLGGIRTDSRLVTHNATIKP